MIIEQIGRVVDRLYMLGNPATPVYLLDGENPAIFDAGFSFLGHHYASAISEVLGSRTPAYCLLTHSHFDHCGSVSALKSHFPEMKIVSSEQAKATLARPNAIELIRELHRAAVKAFQRNGFPIDAAIEFTPFEIDMTVKEGDLLKISPDRTLRVIETPGHTRDCLSYFVPEIKALICSEAAGVADPTGYIVSDCLVDYDQYVGSIKKLELLDADAICTAHRYAFTGADARNYIPRSLKYCDEFRNLVETYLAEEHGDIGRVMTRIKAVEYDVKPEPKQPEPAYLLNLEARVKAVGKRRL
ncbi:MAG: MBL fold metallo-hydrolase [Deltaproteobacteria bacterium]|nr:MBL fold metallo-hydrolase [Deltaproteobacteria bacterium]